MQVSDVKNYLGKDGIIYVIYEGDQSAETLNKIEREIPPLSRKLRLAGKKVLILTDVSKLGRISLYGRIKGAKIVTNLDYDKAAIFGPSHLEKSVVEVIANATGRGFKLKYFNGEKEARAWLKEE